jgi:hypothetical protein
MSKLLKYCAKHHSIECTEEFLVRIVLIVDSAEFWQFFICQSSEQFGLILIRYSAAEFRRFVCCLGFSTPLH